MPKDQRLYMTFPIDFDEHPKIAGLSDSAFRTFVAMNGYSRRHDLDGRIPAVAARAKWRQRSLDELVASHPDRPVVLLDGDTYVIRDYAEHQLTKTEIEDLRAKRAIAGAKGGKARASAKAIASGGLEQIEAESESELERLDIANLPGSSHVPNARAEESDGEFFQAEAAKVGIRDLNRILRAIRRLVPDLQVGAAIDVARAITLLAATRVKHPEKYIEDVCDRSPDVVEREVALLRQREAVPA